MLHSQAIGVSIPVKRFQRINKAMRQFMNIVPEYVADKSNLLTELFSPSSVDWEIKSDTEWHATEEIAGIPYRFDFNKNKFTGAWSFDFQIEDYYAKEHGLDDGFSNNGLAGTKAIRIYSRVISYFVDFMKQKQPEKIVFVGTHDEGKASLYSRIAKYGWRTLEALGYEFIEEPQPRNFTRYTVQKIDNAAHK